MTRRPGKFRRRGEEGFTLLETLIALVIMALALGMAVQAVALASSRLVTSNHARTIDSVARAILADPPAKAGRTEGDDSTSGLRWTVDVRPVAGLEAQRVHAVTVTVVSGTIRRQSYHFRTVSYGGPAQ